MPQVKPATRAFLNLAVCVFSFLTLVFLLLECEKNQDDCWAVGLHQRRACRGVDELSEDLVLQRALLKWKGERYKLQLAR